MAGETEIVLYKLEEYGTDTLCSSFSSFRKTKRTGAGTSLVRLSVRNAACSLAKRSVQSPCILPHFDRLSERLTTLSVSYRVIVLTCGMTEKQNKQ